MSVPQFYDRVKERVSGSGTGNLTLDGTFEGFRTLYSVLSTTQYCEYVIEGNGIEWETGIGHCSASTTFVRDTVITSSNANAAVSFSAGPKTIRITVAARHFEMRAALQADFSKTNNTFANVTDFTFNLLAGRWYSCSIFATLNGSPTGSTKFDLNGGTATATGVEGAWLSHDADIPTLAAAGRITSLSTVMDAAITSAAGIGQIDVLIQVNAAGTLIPRFAQIVTDATPSTIRKYAWMTVKDVTP